MITTITELLISIVLTLSSLQTDSSLPERKINEVILKPTGTSMMTEMIQKAIDKCSDEGGGVIQFT